VNIQEGTPDALSGSGFELVVQACRSFVSHWTNQFTAVSLRPSPVTRIAMDLAYRLPTQAYKL
jgi:hypothetical protein